MTVCGNKEKVYGTIAIVSADNLGSLALGGFKESCSASRMCRHCMTTKPECQRMVSSSAATCAVAISCYNFFSGQSHICMLAE